MEITDIKELENKANEIRKEIVKQVYSAQSGHPGGSLSIADIMAVLYFNELNIDSNNPRWEERDRVVLSKGHCVAALYAALAIKGYYSIDELQRFRKIDGKLQGHPDMKNVLGIDMSTGSLGQGISAAVGMAIAGKLDNKNYRVYTIVGDGEIEEGQVWEALMSASKYKLDNLCVIVDNNNLQIDGTIEEVMNLKNIDKRFESFGFEVITIDGNNIEDILNAFSEAKNIKERPVCILAKTIKGKGVSFMENKVEWHGKAPNEEEYKEALKLLGGNI